MKNILEKIVDYNKLEVENCKKKLSFKDLQKIIFKATPVINFKKELEEKNIIGKAGIIAEIKKNKPLIGKAETRKNPPK